MFKKLGLILLCTALHSAATEFLHPILPIYKRPHRTDL